MRKTGEDFLQAYAGFFERLSVQDLSRLPDFVADDVHFRDPFNDVRGLPAYRHIFEDMFQKTENPRFHVLDQAVVLSRDESVAGFLRWRFEFHPRRKSNTPLDIQPWEILGTSYIRFDHRGKVSEHIDYWDPAENLYEKLPLIGTLFRYLKRAFSS